MRHSSARTQLRSAKAHMTQKNIAARRILVFLSLLLPAGLAIGAPLPGQPDPAQGKELAERLCTNCHLVGGASKATPTPTCRAFTRSPTWKGRRPAPSRRTSFCPSIPCRRFRSPRRELADLSAYILSLRDAGGRQ